MEAFFHNYQIQSLFVFVYWCSWAAAVGKSTISRRNKNKEKEREKNIVMIYGISIKILPLKFITLSMLSDISSQIECGCGYYYIEWVMLLSVCGARAQTPTDTQKYSQKMYFWTIPMNVYSQIASLSWFGLSLNKIGCYRNATQLLRK